MPKVSIACIALWRGRVLVARRNPTGQMGGRWEFPGGKVEEGESDEKGIVREFQEEFGVCARVGEKIAEAEFESNGEKRRLRAYRIFLRRKGLILKYRLTEHTEYKWVEFPEIERLNFVDSDMLIYPAVRKHCEGL